MDISSLRDRPEREVMTVSELNGYLKRLLDGERFLRAVSVRGEISNLKFHTMGHVYFSIKDETSVLRAVMFRSKAEALKFLPENGMKVIAFGSVTVYENGGQYQIIVSSMQPDGIGALYTAYNQLKERLESEGLFDESHKKPIPRLPESIGVITSPSGAAVRDIINVITRRYKAAKIYIYPALVQGEGAEATLVSGIDYFDKSKLVDTVIIGRGGGSIEDLWAFNSERLARRIYEAEVPVISAVGHETDFTICDFVSDLRAPTPSAAAELAVPDSDELIMRLDDMLHRAGVTLINRIGRLRERLLRYSEKTSSTAIMAEIYEKREELSEKFDRTKKALDALLGTKKNEFAISVGKLEAMNPLNVLSRGYSVVESDRGILKSVSEIEVGDTVDIRLSDGRLSGRVVSKNGE
jgi:exodeoxyribonuclease VII large subunit